MSTSPIVIISLAGQLSALEAKSFKSLNDDVQAAYSSFLKDSSSELVLTYHWQGVLLEVKSEQSLSTFLSLFQKGSVDKPARPVSAGRSRSVKTDAEGTLPLLELVQRKKIVAIPTVEELEAEFRASTGGSNATEESAPAASRGPRKAARQDTSPPPETIDTARPASAAGIYEDESPSASPEQNVWISGRGSTASHPNSATARELLASYRPPADPEPESIRIVLRDGSSSVLMPYNSTYPPPLSEMRKFAWNFFKDRLEDRVAEIRGTPEGREAEQRLGKPIDAQKFLLGFWFEGCDLPIDMDDREDELLLKRAVEQFGLRDVIMYVDVPFVELQPVAMNPVTETVLPVSPRGLQVNLTRLPVRDKVRQTVRQQQLQLSQLRDQIKAHKAETDGLNGSRK